MPDRVSPGQPFRTTPFHTADFQNRTIETVEWFHSGDNRGPTAPPIDSLFSTGTVKVKNLTGADRARGEVVQLGDHLLTNINPNAPWFEGNTLAAPAFNVGILELPIKDEKIGRALISGRCLASVSVGDTAHTHAVPVAGQHYLASSDFGPFELCMPAGETGTQELWVRFCDVRPVRLVLTEDLDSGTASAELTAWGGSSWSGTSREYDVFASAGSPELVTDDAVWAIWSPESMRLEIINADQAVQVSTILHFEAGGTKTTGDSTVSAVVTRVLQGDGAAVDDTITVTDPAAIFTAENGSVGKATSDAEGTFWIDWLECPPEEQ